MMLMKYEIAILPINVIPDVALWTSNRVALGSSTDVHRPLDRS